MLVCEKCGQSLKCTLTINDPLTDNEILRRKYCYNCNIVYMTRETIISKRERNKPVNDTIEELE